MSDEGCFGLVDHFRAWRWSLRETRRPPEPNARISLFNERLLSRPGRITIRLPLFAASAPELHLHRDAASGKPDR
jgi:hypothetical protein